MSRYQQAAYDSPQRYNDYGSNNNNDGGYGNSYGDNNGAYGGYSDSPSRGGYDSPALKEYNGGMGPNSCEFDFRFADPSSLDQSVLPLKHPFEIVRIALGL
jgi:hypothetical protein